MSSKKGKPLKGRIVVVTRSLRQGHSFVKRLQSRGAQVLLCPAIELKILPITGAHRRIVDQLRQNLASYDWIIFLSENAVLSFSRLVGRMKPPSKICVVGPKTAMAVRQQGWRVTRMAHPFTSRGVLKCLPAKRGEQVLIPRGKDGDPDLKKSLMNKGVRVATPVVYQTITAARPALKIRRRILRGVDAVTFTSGSCARNFFRFFTPLNRRMIFKRALAVSIGPGTTTVLKKLGARSVVQANQATTNSMVKTLCQHLRN